MDFDSETIRLIQEEFQNDFVVPSKNTSSLSDSALARALQEEYENIPPEIPSEDLFLAQSLQEQFQCENSIESPGNNLVYRKQKKRNDTKSLTDPSWEVIDPTPDIHVLFIAFNTKFFWGTLDAVCVSWSKRMKRCAGICSYQGRGGLCHITLSEPLLKLRPRKDLVETLLHEMIHAYLFVTNNNRDRDGHGPEFHKHMNRINKEAGTNITVYHDFHDEVELYLVHWWRCDGICQKWKPYFGFVRRSSNRAPGPNDKWWGSHSRSCGGTFIKIKSPEKPAKGSKKPEVKPVNSIKKYLEVKNENIPSTSKGNNLHTISNPNSGLKVSVTIPSKSNNIHGFSNSTNKTFNGVKNNSSTIVITKKPSNSSSETKNLNNSDYETVRNHWLNKFSDNKRKKSDDIQEIPNKIPKLSQTSVDSLQSCDEVNCPICNLEFIIDDLNKHLDTCLGKKNAEINPKMTKECIICSLQVDSKEYEEHVNSCIRKNFDNDSNEPVINDFKEIDMSFEKLLCPSCNIETRIDEMEKHLMNSCLKTKLDEQINENNSVDCLACGKRVLKSKLNSHLEECLNEVFGNDSYK